VTTSKSWGDYEVHFDETLGRGGMGAVYKGRQISVNRPVAVKILKRDLTESPDFVRRFYREATLLAKLVDNHIVQIFGAGEAEGQHFYAMELVDGEDLASRLRRGYQFTTEEILQVALQTSAALQAAWKEKIIHRDIKPSNILVTKENVIKVMDFGLAKNPENDLTQTEMIMGTAKYMSPEQATGGRCDIRSDLYSLGAVLYELATGTAPFVGESPTAVIYQHVHKPPVPPQKLNPSVPASLQSAILRLLAKSPDERYQTPEDLIRDCKAILEGVSLDEKTVLYSETAAARVHENLTGTQVLPPESNRVGVYLSVVVVVAALAGGGYLVYRALQNAPTTNGPGPLPPPNGDSVKEKEIRQAMEEGDKAVRGKKWQDAVQAYEKVISLIEETDSRRAGVQRRLVSAQVQYALSEAEVAFGDRKWALAIQNYEKARSLLGESDPQRSEIEAKIKAAHFHQRLDDARSESDLGSKIRLLRNAVDMAPTQQDREIANSLLRAALVKRAVLEAKERVGKDWGAAATAWREAAQNEDSSTERARFEKEEKFCSGMAEYLRLKREEKWEEVKKKIEELLQMEPGEFAELLDRELKAAQEKILAARKSRFDELFRKAQERVDRAEWEQAKALLQDGETPEFEPFHNNGFRALQKRVGRWERRPPGTVYIPHGTYPIGTNDKPDFGPRKEDVEVPGFYIGEREVAVDEYRVFLEALATAGKNHLDSCPSGCAGAADKIHTPREWDSQKGSDPVTRIDWWDAAAFARWKGKGWRLPDELEFEVAASWDPATQSKRKFPWGESGGSGPSAFGLQGLDNVIREWTSSVFKEYPWSARKFGGRDYVLRGGAKSNDYPEQFETTFRHVERPDKSDRGIGFRCVLEIEKDE